MTHASTRPGNDPDIFDQPPPPPPIRRRLATPGAGWSTVAVIAVGAVMTNLAIQGRPASMAGVLATACAGLAILAAPARRTWSVGASVGLAILVASNLVLRASDWVTGPSSIATLALLVLATVDQLTSAGLETVAGSGRVLLAGAKGSIRHAASPFARWLGPSNHERAAVVRGTLIALGVAVFLTLLLANGDAVVGQAIERSLGAPVWNHLVLSAVLATVFASIAAAAHGSVEESNDGWSPAARPIESIMGLGAMVLVLGAWVGVQAAIAAGGADRLLSTAQVTRAEYAREGFFELVIVAAVVLVLLAVFGRLLGEARPLSSVLLLGATGALTIVLVAVTFSRLALYIEAFGLTMLRLSVAWFLGWLAFLVFAFTAWSCGVARQRSWLTTLVVISAAATVTVFGWSNPEATVAATNLASIDGDSDNRDSGDGVVDLDVEYLQTLGPDAAPTLVAAGVKPGIDCNDHDRPYGPFSWNRSWSTACSAEVSSDR